MDSLFDVYFRHGGTFEERDGKLFYIGGDITVKHGVDSDRTGIFDLIDEVKNLGYHLTKMYYRAPDSSEDSIRELKSDKQVLEMIELARKKKHCMVIIYVEGDKIQIEPVAVADDITANQTDTLLFEHEIEDANEEVHVGNQDLQVVQVEVEEQPDLDDDSEYVPTEESDTDDDLEDNELSDDEEYVQARKNWANYKNHIDASDLLINAHNRADVNSRALIVHKFQVKNTNSLAHVDKLDERDTEFRSEYEDSDCDVQSMPTSEDEDKEDDRVMAKKNKVIYDPRCDHKTLEFVLGMRFESSTQCKDAVQRWGILHGKNLHIVRSNSKQLEVICDTGCPWKLYGSVASTDNTFLIKSLVNEHRCARKMNNRQATSTWIAKEYINKFRKNPNWKVQELEDDLMDRYAVQVNKNKCYRAKAKAHKMLRGSVSEHYALLRSYVLELLRVDKNGRFEFLIDDDGCFRGFFVGFSALIDGFLRGCRPIIGFDGCFLKTFLGGALLCAIGKDGNNQMFPICWAVVEAENEFFWTWFLRLVIDQLQIGQGLCWTFISDQQKGLINAICSLAPFAEHRNCARHVYCNWKKQFKGQALKNVFWKAVRSTHVVAFNEALTDMREIDATAYTKFRELEIHRFCEAYISEVAKCDMVDNNISETFNGYIVKTRGKHIIDMLEDIRLALMSRMHEKLMHACSLSDTICPRIRTKLEDIKYNSRLCVSRPAVGAKFQVALGEDEFVVDLNDMTCTCRGWQLSGIPCVHACSSIHFMHKDAADFINSCYTVKKYIETYQIGLEPLRGIKFWPHAQGNPIKPPRYKKMPGRPKKKRRRGPEEDPKNPSKLTRAGIRMRCTICHQVGHNKRSCPKKHDPSFQRPAKLHVKRGRPPKMQPSNEAGSFQSTQQSEVSFVPSRGTQQSDVSSVTSLVNQGYSMRITHESGNMYLSMPENSRVRYVSGQIGAANATRAILTKRNGRGGRRNTIGGRVGEQIIEK